MMNISILHKREKKRTQSLCCNCTYSTEPEEGTSGHNTGEMRITANAFVKHVHNHSREINYMNVLGTPQLC